MNLPIKPDIFEPGSVLLALLAPPSECIRRISHECPQVHYDLIELIASFRSEDLSGIDLGFSILSGINLTGANLSNAKFNFADLQNANLEGVNLKRANLQGAKLQDAKFGIPALDGKRIRGDFRGHVRV